MRIVLTLLLMSWLSLPAWSAEDWPQFRGPSGDGHAGNAKPPTQWSEKSANIRWKTPIHDKGWSSPVILGDQVWLTTALANGKTFFAVCVDKATGKIIHDLPIFTEENPAFCHAYNSYATPTPVIEPGRIYVHFGSHGTACLDTATGKKLWERRDIKCDHFRGPGSSPILYGDLLILTFDGFDVQFLVALNKSTGETVWKTNRDLRYSSSNGDLHKAYSTPSVFRINGNDRLFSPAAESTVAYDPLTGKELWKVNHGGMNEAAKPVMGNGLVYLTSGHTAQLLAVRPNGEGDVTKSDIVWKSPKGVPTRPSLLLDGAYLYMVSDNGIASCLDAKTGKQQWQERLGGAFCASPILANGNLYLCDEEGKIHVIAAKPEYESLAVNKLADGCMASPAVSGNALFIRTKTHLYRIEDGK
ncbi:outer membrane protein assembly factor BamB family protein [Tuwongella immobilis]|uniref:Pyrrolo-quinoline quinone repeat domain-containing protein n=1 Tax=Tuwongella immobilis TaxID=692036 RepID=A0A6C2YRI3_9BACT|nr:PQQ-binding-like beta-propeller repeat protein [Tuwongella immobilis]VIP04096.1 Pyrrolo-quinoline quinone OS=Pirellula staleyi (strain ATCC 27377 / DSM 6068 / ICPB 4128) GN=Psta_1668 PE=4 SV=1: PQQ_2 [Tuwongella immobilis]VTS05559.1 Pyrrolo-quinoline quinone OS=Pirellula staleyi (strain ATCC 27377 / DSM 6068 / ICPB 4128) GN=Psta_1668 PE=4 SV=1: PQQ_2 [Tuwongella immobilis]